MSRLVSVALLRMSAMFSSARVWKLFPFQEEMLEVSDLLQTSWVQEAPSPGRLQKAIFHCRPWTADLAEKRMKVK